MTDHKPLHSMEYFSVARRYWWNYDFLELMSRRWRLEDVRRALDVGCGVGHWTAVLAAYLPLAEVVGVDREEEWIEVARASTRSRARFEHGLAEALPFPDESFDMVTCQTLLIHVPDPVAVLMQMRRVLSPGGLLAIVEPNNRVQTLLATSVTAGDDIDTVLARVRFQLMCERGRAALGEGNFSMGDLVPGLVASLGFHAIQVFQSDKTLALLPPYASDEQAAITAADYGDRFDPGSWMWSRADSSRYFLAAGGTPEDFAVQWAAVERNNERERDEIRQHAFHRAGGRTMYVVSGRK